MNCPHCGKPLPSKLAAKALGSVKSERKAKASAINGKLGGRPRRCPYCPHLLIAHIHGTCGVCECTSRPEPKCTCSTRKTYGDCSCRKAD